MYRGTLKSPKHQNLRDTLATTLPESCWVFFTLSDKAYSSMNNGFKAMRQELFKELLIELRNEKSFLF